MFARALRLHRDQSYFLFGPRGTGESTLLRAELPNAFYVDLLDLGV